MSVRTRFAGALTALCVVVLPYAAPARSVRALHDAGYVDIRVGGPAPRATCTSPDAWRTHFTATTPRADLARGVVCCSLKRCTIWHLQDTP